MKKSAAKGHTKKHAKAATAKHHAKKAKHSPVHHAKTAAAHGHVVHAKAKHPAHAKARALTLDGAACCTTEALAASLRVQGLAVPASAVLDLFRAAGGDEDKGLPIADMLEAASVLGLGGLKPRWAPAGEPLDAHGLVGADHPALAEHEIIRRAAEETRHGLILGVDLPGAHAVLATPEGWWSWGELWCPCEWPDAVIEEAWAVTWA